MSPCYVRTRSRQCIERTRSPGRIDDYFEDSDDDNDAAIEGEAKLPCCFNRIR